MLVSFDSSVRSVSYGPARFGLEFKCPMPGKQCTTDVNYEVLFRYVPQLLAEMHALKMNELVSLYWSEISSAVFHVKNDEKLWNEIWNVCLRSYSGKQSRSQRNLLIQKPNL